ncbi:MAG TPA: ATP-binding protein [Gemmataceae bacterium]|nr:ATP-binding protein [Gemmataceae bacterium]
MERVRRQGRQHGLGYFIAVAATAAVVLLRRFVSADILGPDIPLYLFLFAVLAAAWFGGLKAGLLATALSVLGGTYFIMAPVGWYTAGPGDRVRIVMFLVLGAAISWFTEMVHRSRSRAEQQRESLRITLASIGDAVITTDAEGRVTSLNAVAAAMTGWTQEEAAGRSLEEVFRIINEFTRKTVDGPVKKVLAQGRNVGFANHTLLVAKDGTERSINDCAAPIRDAEGKIQGVVLIFRDISEQKRLYQQLQEADRRKDEFLAVLAHELRNPLAPIRNALGIMRLASNNPTALDQVRTIMERQLQQMVRLIDDLLDVSRITRGKLHLRKERVELALALRNAVETARPLIEASDHELTVTLPAEPIYVGADEARLAQILSNLLNNAAKFTERGGHIWLTAAREDNAAVLTVKDSGVGIPADHLPHIFEMFSQVDQSLERSQGGLGIGLTLVKRLTEMHGGAVEARSDGHNKGSEFTVRLPLAGEPPAQPQPTPAACESKAASVQCKVLIVDDNEDAAASMSTILHIMGHEARVAHDGPKAVEEAASYRPDVVLLDIGLPKMSGYEVARHIREQPWGKEMKLVALTGWGQEEDKRRAKAAGFDLHMVKPVELAVLEEVLKKLCPS